MIRIAVYHVPFGETLKEELKRNDVQDDLHTYAEKQFDNRYKMPTISIETGLYLGARNHAYAAADV